MINQLWPTPFLKISMPADLRDKISNWILVDYDLNNPPSDFSEFNILESTSPEIVEFKNDVILPAFNQFLQETVGKDLNNWKYKLKGWVTGSGKYYNINYHNHRGAQLSAVFYLWCDDKNAGGQITFTDPRHNANRGYDESFKPWFQDLTFTPENGDIVVFPSFLYHFVSTYHGNIRLAMPVDLFLHNSF